jgi:hypothetical protein
MFLQLQLLHVPCWPHQHVGLTTMLDFALSYHNGGG